MIDNGLYSTCSTLGNNFKVVIHFIVNVDRNARDEYAKEYGNQYYIIETSQTYCNTNDNYGGQYSSKKIYRAFVQNAYTGKMKIHTWGDDQNLVAAILNKEINKIKGRYSEEEQKKIKESEEERKSEGQFVFNIGKTTQIEDFIMMNEDLGKLTFKEAQIAIKKLGDGWRLPSTLELKKINNLKVDSKTNGKKYYYMSSDNEYAKGDTIFYTTFEKTFGDVVKNNIKKSIQNIKGSKIINEDKSFVRAVKSVDNYETFGQTNFDSRSTISIANFEIMTVDLGRMKWEKAKKACENLGNGWHLPSLNEISNLNEFDKSSLFKLNFMPNTKYWTLNEDGNQFPYTFARFFEFGDGKFWYNNEFMKKSEFLNVRALRVRQVDISKTYLDRQIKLEIMKSDYIRGSDWIEMNKKIKDLGNGWRLPTADELKYIRNIMAVDELFGCYWVDDQDYKTSSYGQENENYHRVGNCNSKFLQSWQKINVRLVKDKF